MKSRLVTILIAILLGIFCDSTFIPTASGQGTNSNNSWTNTVNDTSKWETGSNWSLGIPPSTFQSVLITNRVTAAPRENRQKTVEIDSTTANSFPGSMTISLLTVSAPSADQNTLFVSNTGSIALTIKASLTISNQCVVSIANSDVEMGIPAGTLSVDCRLVLNGGSLTTVGEGGTANAIVGNTSVGQVTVLDGTWRTATLSVGNAAGSQGTLTLAGGTTVLAGDMYVGVQPSAVGTVWLTGGELTSINGFNNFDVFIGVGGVGQMTVSNGTWLVESATIGTSGASGTLTVDGGSSSVYSNLLLGPSGCTGTGTLMVDGGSLFVTNAAHNAMLEVESGTVTLSGGTLVVDGIVITRSCGSFQQTGGTLVIGGVTNIVTALPFSITSITSDGHNISVQWQSPGETTNFVQATNGNPDGGYNTNFVDISPPILIAVPGTNQYTDIGGATNMPARYYRVRRAM